MENIIRDFKRNIVQISTPYGNGSGFFLKNIPFIITNCHVIDQCADVTVKKTGTRKHRTRVLFRDKLNDIALLENPFENLSEANLSETPVTAGQRILAIGHPLGLSYTATQGIVSKEDRLYNGLKYIQIDAAINPGNSGGPLINEQGEVVGVNTFIMRDSESLGFAVPSASLKQAISDYTTHAPQTAFRCKSCSTIITKERLDGKYCPNCGNPVDIKEIDPPPYEAVSTAKKIETILENIGLDVFLAREGYNVWKTEDKPSVRIFFDDKSGFVYNDSKICKLPKLEIGKVYEYILRENYGLEGNSFSVYNSDIILGSVVYSEDIDAETTKGLFRRLIEKSKKYYDTLLNVYQCEATEDEE